MSETNQIENKTEIVLRGDQFIRRVTQETPIGTQERFIKQIIDQHKAETLWSRYPMFQGSDIDDTGMVKRIWTGNVESEHLTRIMVELNYFPLCGACLEKTERAAYQGYCVRLGLLRHPEVENENNIYFDDNPLRIPILPEHNARVFLSFAIRDRASTPSVFMLRNNRPRIPVGLPNIFLENGELCPGKDWSWDTDKNRLDSRRFPSTPEGYSIAKHIEKCLNVFSATPANMDLCTQSQLDQWGTWSKEGVLTPHDQVPPRSGSVHTNSVVCDFVKHLLH